jgi:hypothetical protein
MSLEGMDKVIELGILSVYIAVWRSPATRHQVVLSRIDGNAVQPQERTVTSKIAQRPIRL